ncbi:hypothetical protein PR003_g16896 [Phytophthora rubi]|uniref:Uncharacterized protein n=1 Tax=Phytophthora rubi TaxID=129364 RepID=A0A6A3JGZ7_9STRA|nr:hypothetical protein PR002_g19947 [Phytophthora rubi]KAE9010273.1 hypothetical protein PR001_g16215 [Phytophthora rubi]KAE9323785.1 hypothetical protein PR003_g16896 [Phytophthora rubi]
MAANVTVLAELTLRCSDATLVQKLESPVLLGPLDHIT